MSDNFFSNVVMPQTDSIKTRFDAFVVRLINSGVASPTDLVGCSDEEIDQLERKYEIRLPTSYRLFLQVMGRSRSNSGRMFPRRNASHSPPMRWRFPADWESSGSTSAAVGRMIRK